MMRLLGIILALCCSVPAQLQTAIIAAPSFGPGSTGFLPTCSYSGYSPSTCPAGIAFRDFSSANYVSQITYQTGGSYIDGGVSDPRIASWAYISGTYYGLAACTATGYHWQNICLFRGTPLSWTLDTTDSPVATYSSSTYRDHWLLHPSWAPACSVATYCAYYSSLDASGHTSISLITSPNGTTWTQYAGNPIIPYTGGGGYNNPQLPSVILSNDGTQLIMHTGSDCLSNGTCTGPIIYWTSPVADGINWTFGGVSLPVPISGDWDYTWSILDPEVFRNGHGFCEMVYTSFINSGESLQNLGYAVSQDCKKFYKYQTATILTQSSSGYTGTLPYIGDATLFEDGIRLYFLYDTGNGSVINVGQGAFMVDF